MNVILLRASSTDEINKWLFTFQKSVALVLSALINSGEDSFVPSPSRGSLASHPSTVCMNPAADVSDNDTNYVDLLQRNGHSGFSRQMSIDAEAQHRHSLVGPSYTTHAPLSTSYHTGYPRYLQSSIAISPVIPISNSITSTIHRQFPHVVETYENVAGSYVDASSTQSVLEEVMNRTSGEAEAEASERRNSINSTLSDDAYEGRHFDEGFAFYLIQA